VNPLHLVAALATGAAAVADLRTGKMPNRITLGALLVGVVGSAALPAWEGSPGVSRAVLTSLGGALVASVVPYVLWRARALGGGDVKLFVALGALLGPLVGLEAQMMAFAFGALVIPFRLAWEGRLFATLARSLGLVTNMFVRPERRRPVDAAAMTWFRLGPAIFAGTVLALAARGAHP